MKTYKFFEIENGKKKYIKTYFDVSHRNKSYCSYYKTDKNGQNYKIPTSAIINELFIIAPKDFPKNMIWEKFVRLPLFESYSNQDDIKFSSSINDIIPDFERNKYVKDVDILFGFIFPEMYLNFSIYRYEYFEDVKPSKERYIFFNNIDELLVLNKYTSYENKTLLRLNN